MATVPFLRPIPDQIPESPGVYRFYDAHDRVIYVGKAKNLRARLSSYFTDPATLHPRTRTMLETAARLEWTVVRTEVEALQLEYNWIKQCEPRFNVKYRDDKSYPYLAVTLSEPVPRLMVYRGKKKKGNRYFGPYSHAWAIRDTLDLLLRVFPARTCSAGVYRRAQRIGRPCLLGHIGKCSAPCVGWVSEEQHRAIVLNFCDFMAGRAAEYVRRLEQQMRDAAAAEEFERAARIRDDIAALRRALEKQTVVLPDETDADVVALADDELEAAVQVFFVREGRVRGQRGWVVEKVEDLDAGELVQHFLTQLYGETGEESADIPREILVPTMPADHEALSGWLAARRGAKVDIRVPRRGDKKTLMETVARNAAQALALHKARRAGDLTTRSQALREIQDALELPEAPLRIECYDVSNLQGTDVVASMVVFEDGLPRRNEYRRFQIRGLTGGDVAAIHEVILRRFRRYLDERMTAENQFDADPGSPISTAQIEAGTPERVRTFSYPPGLVVVDGGAPQVAAARRALDELGIDEVAVVGLAKRLEELWLPGSADPVILPRSSEGLYLLQRIRDEAHRFALAYHRTKRSKAMTRSVLEGIPGLGEVRRKAFLRHFGSVKRMREATVEELAAVPGVGRRTAEAVHAALHRTSG
ncbi:MAG: excinuclease ABC subunit UvrC [Acidothermus sp.]|nr:excinuclease ABC subunit UvrC [Acidothermus sp.]